MNLAPADQKKEGPAFDLPIALTIMACMGKLDPAALSGTAIIGEVALDGTVRPVRGALPMVISALEAGVKRFLLPADNENEVRCVEGIALYCVSSLTQAAEHLSGKHPIPPVKTVAYSEILARRESPFDFKTSKVRPEPVAPWKSPRPAATIFS